MLSDEYVAVANTLKDRIISLIPENPSILAMDSCWDLFDVPGFRCDDLSPTMAQASWALAKAKAEWNRSRVAN
jgi:hypothetical protein